MTTSEDSSQTSAALKSQLDKPAQLGFRWPASQTPITHSTQSFGNDTEDAFARRFENVGLGSKDNDDIIGNHLKDLTGRLENSSYPLRPYAEDCPHYLKTGTCKFGPNCRFNHPVNRSNQVGKEEDEKGKDNELLPEMSEQIECKYYLTAGGCKYGNSCRFRHSKIESEIAPLVLNFLGLPIRLGEKECPFYMRNGSCGYGFHCKFNHPDPTAVGAFESHSSAPNNILTGRNYPSQSTLLPVNGASQQGQALWSSPMMCGTNVTFQDNNLYMNPTPPLHHGTRETFDWNGYKVSAFPEGWTRTPSSAPIVTSYATKADNTSQLQEFPERPGQPECDYYMKTGNCKFKSACRYHHPANRTSNVECVLSDKGLPLRPGRKVCRHYEQYGICKYGRACLFDHPVTINSSTSS